MDSTLTVNLRITHSRNLPPASVLAALAAVGLTEVLADDPKLSTTATLQSAAVTVDAKAPQVRLAERHQGIR